MGVKTGKKKKGDGGSKQSDKDKSAAKKRIKEDKNKVTRKGFILDTIKGNGKSGIKLDKLIETVDAEFDYAEGKSSRMRVGNTIKEAVEGKLVSFDADKGIVTWKK